MKRGLMTAVEAGRRTKGPKSALTASIEKWRRLAEVEEIPPIDMIGGDTCGLCIWYIEQDRGDCLKCPLGALNKRTAAVHCCGDSKTLWGVCANAATVGDLPAFKRAAKALHKALVRLAR